MSRQRARASSLDNDAKAPLLSTSPQSSSKRQKSTSKQQAKATSLKHSWYVDDVSQIDKKATLKKKHGRFMVHPDGKGGYELAVNCRGAIWTVKIKHKGGGFCTYIDGEDGELFPSLEKLIKHHRGLDGRAIELEPEKQKGRNIMLSKQYISELHLCYAPAGHDGKESTASQLANGHEEREYATTLEVTTHPESLIDVKPATKVQFSMTATGKGKLKYKWQKDGVYLNNRGRIKGASTSTLSITAVQKSDEGGYTCVADNGESVTSQPAILTLATPPQVTSHPVSPTLVVPGSDMQFSVTATGTAPLRYQWQKDGVNLTDGGRIKGASTSTLSITAVQKSDECRYRSVVTNTAGTDTSTSSKLTLGIPKKWYIEETDAKKARYVLLHGSAGKNGSFLVFKNSNDMYALLVNHNESIFKLGINESIDENEKKYYTIGKDGRSHRTITELIKHHRGITGTPIKLQDGTYTTLSRGELKTVGFPADKLFHKPWHFVATPKDAVARMANAKKKEDGTFLVYKNVHSDSSHEESDSYVLLVYYQGEIKKMEIIRKRKTDGGEKFIYVLGKDGKNAKPHETVRLLIKYHRGSAGKHIELGDGNKVILFDYLKWEE